MQFGDLSHFVRTLVNYQDYNKYVDNELPNMKIP